MLSNKDFHKKYLEIQNNLDNINYEDLYWHGTGRFQYNENSDIKDVLKEIIKNNGLLPLVKDPWLKSDNEYKYTISLAKNRMYASIYALVHQNRNNPLQFLHKTRQFWAWRIGLNNLIHTPLSISQYAISFLFRENSTNSLISFQSKFNKKIKKRKTFWGQLLSMPNIRSDIPKNYAILFAIKKDTVKETNLNSGFSFYEARTEDPITFEQISHIEVPIENIEETKKLFKKHNLQINVLPIELVEYDLMNNYTIKNLLKPTK